MTQNAASVSSGIVRIEIRRADQASPEDVRRFLVDAWHGETVVGHGETMAPAEMPGFVAVEGGRIVGHASYRTAGKSCELVSIAAQPRLSGVGSRLLDAIIEAARAAGCGAVWLTTTNDNLDALRFYQRRGFRLVRLRPDAVDEARASLKPEIPLIGSYGIPMRDELDLEREL